MSGGHNGQVLRQLVRHQNRKHAARYYFETAFSYTIYGLRDEAARMKAENGRTPTAKQMACDYDGCSCQRESALKQTGTTALRLSQRVINAIGEIVTSEHPDQVASPCALSGTVRPFKSSRTKDFGVLLNFIHITSLRFCIQYINVSGTDGKFGEVKSFYRVHDMCRLHNLKPVSYRQVG